MTVGRAAMRSGGRGGTSGEVELNVQSSEVETSWLAQRSERSHARPIHFPAWFASGFSVWGS